MKGRAGGQPGAAERVHSQLQTLRERVDGIRGSMVASSDGLLIAHDIVGMEPTRLAALISTTLSLAKQATRETGLGEFRESVSRGADGYLVVYAAGSNAVVAVLGDDRLNVALLHYEARETIANIAAESAGFARWSGAGRGQ